jgi:hypothetical protein
MRSIRTLMTAAEGSSGERAECYHGKVAETKTPAALYAARVSVFIEPPKGRALPEFATSNRSA